MWGDRLGQVHFKTGFKVIYHPEKLFLQYTKHHQGSCGFFTPNTYTTYTVTLLLITV